MKDLVILKIGGSVCTDKSRNSFRVRSDVVKRIGKEIRDARMEKAFRLIVVNGAGPFGHLNVKRYDINNGLHTEKDYEGFSKTLSDCTYLNWKVSDTLRSAGLVTMPYPSSSVAIQVKKKLVSVYLDNMKRIWDANDSVIPVLNGTMVPDMKLGSSPMSGDAIIEYLARRLSPKSIIFLTDVDGVFDKDPNRFADAKLLKTITKDDLGSIKRYATGSSNVDVTGGMLGKLKNLLELNSQCYVVNGNRPGNTRAVLLDEPVKGTLINPF